MALSMKKEARSKRRKLSKEAVFKALPGYASEIRDKTDMRMPEICRHLRTLEAEKLAHIDMEWTGPAKRGMRWERGPAPPGSPAPPPKRPKPARPKLQPQAYVAYKNTKAEDDTIAQAKQRPASWCAVLGST